MSRRAPAPRTLLALPAGLALLVGIDAGLGLLRVWAPVESGRLEDVHGILMVLGFVGTLIALERAVALGRPAGYASPALLGVGALGLFSARTDDLAGWLVVAGAFALCVLYVPLWRRQRDDAVLISALGAVAAFGGALLWRGGADTSVTVPWLAAFLVLTIAGERLELARLAMPAHAGRDLVLLAYAVLVGVAATTLFPAVGAPLLGLALLALAAWLVAHDVSRRTVHGAGLPRFAAYCMLAGQALARRRRRDLAGGRAGPGRTGVRRGGARRVPRVRDLDDHGPRAVDPARRDAGAAAVPPAHVRPWALLQASLVVRLWGGDALGSDLARQVGGAGNAIALLLFLVVAVGSAAAGAPTTAPRREAVPA